MFNEMISKIKGKNLKIVFPEGNDVRILKAVSDLKIHGFLEPILLGNRDEVLELAQNNDIDLQDVTIIDPLTYDKLEEMIATLVEVRQNKNTKEECINWLKQTNYFGTMLVYMKDAHGLVGGATYSTGDTVRPALQIIKTKPGIKKVSSAFVLVKAEEKYVMGDCAINDNPTAADLAEIAVECSKTARVFNIDPKVALLSFSTLGSAKGVLVDKVVEAKKILDSEIRDFPYEGELQFDAAINLSVGKQKAPNSPVAGLANVFIFPSLEAGNIGYKIAQRLGSFEAVGPILQGLNAPINDLSRGCSVDEIYKLAIITASQAL